MAEESKNKITRRDFLYWAAITSAGIAATGCTPKETPTAVPASEAGEEASATVAPTVAPTAAAAAAIVKTMQYAETGDFHKLSGWSTSNVDFNFLNQVYSRLLWKDGDGVEHPDIAKEWEFAPDGLSFTAKMRENVTWHDGLECVADDFVTMFGYLRDEELLQEPTVQKMADLFTLVESVEAVDKYTLKFTFSSPMPYFTESLDYWYAVRIEDRSDPGMQKTLPVGTGPFKFVEREPTQYARFERHEGYHLEGIPHFDEWMFNRLERAETLLPNLESGASHGIFAPPASEVARMLDNDNFVVEINDNQGSFFDIMFNDRIAPFDKKQVRQAFSYAMNREAMVENAFFGVSQPIHTWFWSPVSLGYVEELANAYPFDLDKAASLLESAGVDELEVDIHVTSRWPQMKLYSLIWQADLAKIGVTLNVREVEAAQFYEIGGDKELLGNALHPWLNIRASRDPVVFMSQLLTMTRRYEWAVLPQIEELAEQGASELDPEKRASIYQEMNHIMTEEVPSLVIASDPRVWIWSKDVKGAVVDLCGCLRLVDAEITA